MYVHYASAPIEGDWVIPWDDLPKHLKERAGHEGRVHESSAHRHQWRSDRAYVAEVADERVIFGLGTGYSDEDHWIYEVAPEGTLEPDPEITAPAWSRLCIRAQVVRCLHDPSGTHGHGAT